MSPQMSRKVIHTANMTIARIQLAKGGEVASHAHHNEQVCTVISGRVRFLTESGAIELGPNESLEIPSNAPHGVVALEDSELQDLFAPRREDWISGDDAYLRR